MQFLHDVNSMHGRYKEVIISKKRLSDVSVFIGGYNRGGMGVAIHLPLLPPKLPPPLKNSQRTPGIHDNKIILPPLADLGGGGVTGVATSPFQISKVKESNKTKQKIEDNPLQKEEERKSCMFI